MKRIALSILLLLLGLPVLAFAQDELHWLSPTIGGNDAVMIVNNGDDWRTRLNLRSEQRKGSEIRGRIYTGTRVEIYQDNGEWCTVGLNFEGGEVITGEVMKQYLSPLTDGFSALCPIAVAKMETSVTSTRGEVACLQPGDEGYVMAVCGEQYFLLVPGEGQGYAPISAFEELTETPQEKRIVYREFYVPEGGITFADERTGETVFLAGGVLLRDCWQIAGESDWHIIFGAGIQSMLRVEAVLPEEMLSEYRLSLFEGKVYTQGMSFIINVGEMDGRPILQRIDQSGDVFWALGDIPRDAVQMDSDLCIIECEAEKLLSQEEMQNIIAYVGENGSLDERTDGGCVSDAVLKRSRVCTSLVLEPGEREPLYIHAWLEDSDGSYITGGDLDPKTGEIIRWGCNA